MRGTASFFVMANVLSGLLGSVHGAVAGGLLAVSLKVGWQDGFDIFSVGSIIIFTFVLMMEIFYFFTNPELILQSRWVNVAITLTKIFWLLLMLLLGYGLFWDGGLRQIENWWVYLVVMIVIFCCDLPLLVFHSCLCSDKIRDETHKLHQEYKI